VRGLCCGTGGQGENNAQYCSQLEYNCLFTSMAVHWRRQFGQSELPIGWVQIGGYASDPYDKGGASMNSVIRFAQVKNNRMEIGLELVITCRLKPYMQ
jgi:hypothetical protein